MASGGAAWEYRAMNKAFVKETDDEDELPEPPRPAAHGTEPITPEGHRALSDELNRLWTAERPKVTEEVAAAAAQGDRSENAEYIYGKKRLREIDRRIRFLTKRLESVVVVRPADEQQGRAFFGAWLTIADEDGDHCTYRLVGTDETDPTAGKISVKAPLGQALLGKREGESAVVQRPKGPTEVTLVKIWYEG
jgi:transcription elongation factor GreB